jgi:hypothetical protein
MDARQINSVSTAGLILLSSIALVDVVLLGYGRAPLADEGAAAHIFQLAIILLAPVGLVFLATSDWTEPFRAARRLAFPAVITVLAFAALYYLENYYYPAHYPPPQRNATCAASDQARG